MPFNTSTIQSIEERFKKTLAKEYKKHNISKIEEIPDLDRREQFQRIQNTLNHFKTYPSNISVAERQDLLAYVLRKIELQINKEYEDSTLNKGLRVLGLTKYSPSTSKNSVLGSDIGFINGISDTNQFDDKTFKSFNKKYNRYIYLEEGKYHFIPNKGDLIDKRTHTPVQEWVPKTEVYYEFEKNVKPQQTFVETVDTDRTDFLLKSKLKHNGENVALVDSPIDSNKKLFGPINVPWKKNYVYTETDLVELENKEGKLEKIKPKNKRIADNTDPYHYLATRQRSLLVDNRKISLPSERDTYFNQSNITKGLIASLHNFEKNTLKKVDQSNQQSEPKKEIKRPTLQNLKSIKWEKVVKKQDGKEHEEWVRKKLDSDNNRPILESAKANNKRIRHRRNSKDKNQEENAMRGIKIAELNPAAHSSYIPLKKVEIEKAKPIKLRPNDLEEGMVNRTQSHHYEVDEVGASKAFYFQKVHDGISQHRVDELTSDSKNEAQKSHEPRRDTTLSHKFMFLKPIPKENKEKLELMEKNRLGSEFKTKSQRRM